MSLEYRFSRRGIDRPVVGRRGGSDIPAEAEIARAVDIAIDCYSPVSSDPSNFSSRLFLVPYSGEEESLICMAAAFLRLPHHLAASSRRVTIVGTNTSKRAQSSSIRIVNDPEGESSLYLPASVLYYMGWGSRYALIHPEAELETVAASMAEWLEEDPDRVLCFACRMSEGGSNQDTTNRIEDVPVAALISGESSHVRQSFKVDTGDGRSPFEGPFETPSRKELTLLSLLVSQLGLSGHGRVLCYTDSLEKREGWTVGAQERSHSSFLSMEWSEQHLHLDDEIPLVRFDVDFFISFVRSAAVAFAERKTPPHLPSWSAWHQRKKGVIVSFFMPPPPGEIGEAMKRGEIPLPIAGKGISIENGVTDTPEAAVLAVSRALDHASAKGNGIPDLWRADFSIDILQPRSQWRTLHPLQLFRDEYSIEPDGRTVLVKVPLIAPEHDHCLLLEFANGAGSFFAYDTWKRAPETPFSTVLSSLCIESGMPPYAWQEPQGVSLSLFKSIRLFKC